MAHATSPMAFLVFLGFAAAVLGISWFLGRRAKSAAGYFTAGGNIHWAVNGIAFAGDYLSAASFLGICGMIAFYGYDGFLYSIGYLAGWVVALFVIAEPLKRLGRYTFADALDQKFNSRGLKLAAAVSTLVVSCFYLIPQMVGAGALVKPLLGLPQYAGVIGVGGIVTFIVTTAGMVSTTWVQFIKGSMLVLLCAGITVLVLLRGVTTKPTDANGQPVNLMQRNVPEEALAAAEGAFVMPSQGAWHDQPLVRVRQATGEVVTWHRQASGLFHQAQTLNVQPDGRKSVNGRPMGSGPGQATLAPVGYASKLPGGVEQTGPLGPFDFLRTMQNSEVILWDNLKLVEADGSTTTVYVQKPTAGKDFMAPGSSPTFRKVRSEKLFDKLDFLSLMLALFCGTASLPHILIRYYTVKDQASARKSTIMGIAAIGCFYILTLFLGLGAMTSGALDVTDSNMSAPLLARSINEWLFAIISAVAFTTVLGTVSGLIMAASGAVAHDLMTHVMKLNLNDAQKVKSAKVASVGVGVIAIALGIVFSKMNVNFLVGWAFNIAASANLPSLLMLLFWRRTTKQGITAAIIVGMVSSLGWILLSAQTYKDVYGLNPADALVPFSQPAIVTIPLGFLVLIVVSLLSPRPPAATLETAAAEPA